MRWASALAVTVAGDGVGAAGGIDDDLRQEDAGRTMHGGDLRHGDAFFVAAERRDLTRATRCGLICRRVGKRSYLVSSGWRQRCLPGSCPWDCREAWAWICSWNTINRFCQ